MQIWQNNLAAVESINWQLDMISNYMKQNEDEEHHYQAPDYHQWMNNKMQEAIQNWYDWRECHQKHHYFKTKRIEYGYDEPYLEHPFQQIQNGNDDDEEEKKHDIDSQIFVTPDWMGPFVTDIVSPQYCECKS